MTQHDWKLGALKQTSKPLLALQTTITAFQETKRVQEKQPQRKKVTACPNSLTLLLEREGQPNTCTTIAYEVKSENWQQRSD